MREIVAACIFLLRQSCRKYGDWAKRHKSAVRKLDRVAVRRLVELTISDVEASPWNYEMPWQLEPFAGGVLVAEAKKAASCVCAACERTFYPHPEDQILFNHVPEQGFLQTPKIA